MKKDYIPAISRYLKGEMETQERIDFVKALESNPELRNALEQYRDHQLKREPEIAPAVSEPTPKKQSYKAYVAYVLVVALVVTGLLVWAPWSGGLYRKYSTDKQIAVRDNGTAAKDPIAAGAALFNKGDYEGAKKIFQREYMMNPQNPMLSYYFAITLIETSKEYEARTILMHLYNGESAYKYNSAYYVALSFVKEDQKDKAIEWLNKVPAGAANHQNAQALIIELK